MDYGVGNLYSLRCSLEYVGQECAVTDEEALLAQADQVILPGVGAFEDAAKKLRARGLEGALRRLAQRGKPLLGICLGMQLLFERSHEYGLHEGLGLLAGDVLPLAPDLGDARCRVPQIGWNTLEWGDPSCPLLGEIRRGDAVYYVHSYYVPRGRHTAAWSGYGKAAVSGVVWRDNVFGVQFHPEKSGAVGLGLLRAFCATREKGGGIVDGTVSGD